MAAVSVYQGWLMCLRGCKLEQLPPVLSPSPLGGVGSLGSPVLLGGCVLSLLLPAFILLGAAFTVACCVGS